MSFDRVLAALRAGPPPAQSRDSQAVLFSSPWKRAADGWCIATRAYARAMHEAGLGVILRDWHTQTVPEPEALSEVKDIVFAQPPSWSLHVFSSTLGSASNMQVLDALLENRELQTYYCVFERRHIEPALAAKLNRLRSIWVQCQMNRTVLLRAGVKNVVLHRYPYFDDDPYLTLPLPDREPRKFYYIGRFEPRKAPDNVIRAFLRAFRPGESELVIKTSPIPHTLGDYPGPEAIIEDELSLPEIQGQGWNQLNWQQNIWIIHERLPPQYMLKLHEEGDVYVSASRGEGLDLPAWAAKLSGRRIITTASGGPEDFLDPETDLLVPASKLMPADTCYRWGTGATYIDYELSDLISAMRLARWDPKPGTRDWPTRSEHHSSVVGQGLKQWVQECLH